MFLRKIELMHFLFHECKGHKCGECSNLCKYVNDYNHKIYRKCGVYGDTKSEASDWCMKYEACGMLNKEWNKPPIIGMRIKEKEAIEEPLPGQMNLFEEVK